MNATSTDPSINPSINPSVTPFTPTFTAEQAEQFGTWQHEHGTEQVYTAWAQLAIAVKASLVHRGLLAQGQRQLCTDLLLATHPAFAPAARGRFWEPAQIGFGSNHGTPSVPGMPTSRMGTLASLICILPIREVKRALGELLSAEQDFWEELASLQQALLSLLDRAGQHELPQRWTQDFDDAGYLRAGGPVLGAATLPGWLHRCLALVSTTALGIRRALPLASWEWDGFAGPPACRELSDRLRRTAQQAAEQLMHPCIRQNQPSGNPLRFLGLGPVVQIGAPKAGHYTREVDVRKDWSAPAPGCGWVAETARPVRVDGAPGTLDRIELRSCLTGEIAHGGVVRPARIELVVEAEARSGHLIVSAREAQQPGQHYSGLERFTELSEQLGQIMLGVFAQACYKDEASHQAALDFGEQVMRLPACRQQLAASGEDSSEIVYGLCSSAVRDHNRKLLLRVAAAR